MRGAQIWSQLGWLALSAGLVCSSAQAAILWYGGEDTSFTLIGSPSIPPGTPVFRASFARTAIGLQNGTSTSDPPANRIQTPTFSASSNIWIHFQFYTTSNATTSGEQALLVRSPDGVSRIVVRQTGTGGQLKVSSRNSAGTFVDLFTASTNYSASTQTALDLNINYTCSGAGSVTLYYGAISAGSSSGSPCTDAATTLNQVELMSVNNSSAGNCSTGEVCISEVIVASEDTRSMSLATNALQAAGNTQQCTPSTLANVNKSTINDATLISTSTNNQLCQWTMPTSAPTGTWAVKSVSQEARLLVSTTGPQNFDWSWRISGADYLSGTTTPGTGSFANYRIQQDTSPATSTTWGISEVYNTSTNQMNIGIKSLP